MLKKDAKTAYIPGGGGQQLLTMMIHVLRHTEIALYCRASPLNVYDR